MRTTITTLLFYMVACCAAADEAADGVVGVWLTDDGDGLIRIERANTTFQGRVLGGIKPDGEERFDVNNPDPALRDRSLMGMVMMGDFSYDGRRWSGGWIYDPDNGKQYKARMKLEDENTLELRGYIGTPMLGRTVVWRRYTEALPPHTWQGAAD